ncbi:MAG TPA: tetratricopeptide repeat protein [Burkholderiales bacterium]|nr:tetratricopeptide repeat protein [Burkholderiales bacterium]
MGKAERQQKRIAAGWQAVERGDFRLADEIAGNALRKDPSDADFLALRGTSLVHQRRFEEALAPLREVVRKAPAKGIGYLLGHCYLGIGDPKNAEAVLRRETESFPDLVEAGNLLGIALVQQSRHQEALPLFASAIERNPRFAEAYLNLGNALHELGRHEEAILHFRKTLELRPGFLEAYNTLGNAYRALKRHDLAIECYREALRVAPGDAKTHTNLGVALADLGRHDEAIASYEAALSVRPNSANAHYNLGVTLQELKRHGEAIACFEKTIEIDPGHEHAFAALVSSEIETCLWGNLDAHVGEMVRRVKEGSLIVEPFIFLLVSQDLGDQRLVAERHVRKTCAAPSAPERRLPEANRPIRLAYLSANFNNHAMPQLMVGLFEAHDRSRFETTAVSFGKDDRSEIRLRLERSFDRFIDVRARSDAEVSRLLEELEVDIAIDLMGHTDQARPEILARRPAPIQVSYMGYPGPMGAGFIDYILADEFVLPREHQAFYSEKVVTLPDCYLVNDSKRKISERTPTRGELGLPEKGFVFCCFNKNTKIQPLIFSIWARLLTQIPGSVLWLLEDNAGARQNLQREAQARGVDPGRLIFAPRIKTDEHLARHRVADLFLDTLPCNAHTTASDALWAGLPIVTCPGRTFAGRVAGSLLRAVGLPELIAQNLEEYEALALKLATNGQDLKELRAKLAGRRLSAPLFDTDRFRRHVESAYATMQDIRRRGEKPRGFSVEAIE